MNTPIIAIGVLGLTLIAAGVLASKVNHVKGGPAVVETISHGAGMVGIVLGWMFVALATIEWMS